MYTNCYTYVKMNCPPSRSSYPLEWLVLPDSSENVCRRGQRPFYDFHTHCRHVARQRSRRISQHREQSRLPSPLETDHHQLHPVVGLAVTQLCAEVREESFGRATSDPRQEVVGDVGERDAVESQLPAVVQSTETERKRLQLWVTAGMEGERGREG